MTYYKNVEKYQERRKLLLHCIAFARKSSIVSGKDPFVKGGQENLAALREEYYHSTIYGVVL